MSATKEQLIRLVDRIDRSSFLCEDKISFQQGMLAMTAVLLELTDFSDPEQVHNYCNLVTVRDNWCVSNRTK
jgi:hypothetical protein